MCNLILFSLSPLEQFCVVTITWWMRAKIVLFFPTLSLKVHPLRHVCCPAPLCLLLQLCQEKGAWNQQPRACRSPPKLPPPHHCVYLKTAIVPSETLRLVWKCLIQKQQTDNSGSLSKSWTIDCIHMSAILLLRHTLIWLISFQLKKQQCSY